MPAEPIRMGLAGLNTVKEYKDRRIHLKPGIRSVILDFGLKRLKNFFTQRDQDILDDNLIELRIDHGPDRNCPHPGIVGILDTLHSECVLATHSPIPFYKAIGGP